MKHVFDCCARPFTLALFLLFVLSGSVHAHHGWRNYAVDFDFEATVSKTRYANPHDQIWVVDADGKEWNFLLAPPTRNRRLGFDETTVVDGQKVRLVGRHEEGGSEGKVHFIYDEEGETLYTYYYDNGVSSWERSQR